MNVRTESPTTDIGELLAIARIDESTFASDEAVSPTGPVTRAEPRPELRSRVRKLLRRFKP